MISTKPLYQALKIAGLAASVSLASLVISPKANAVLLQPAQTVSFTNRVTELTGTPQLTVNKYSGAGIVNQVVVTILGNLSSTGTLTNNSVTAQDFDVNTSGRLRLTPVSGAPSALVTANVIPTGTLIGAIQEYTAVPAGGEVIFPTQTVNNQYSLTITNLAQISEFLGAGTFSYAPTTSIGTTIFGGGGNIVSRISTVASASLKVEYFGVAAPPSEVPEPSSILGILALTGSGAAMMRKFKSLVKLA